MAKSPPNILHFAEYRNFLRERYRYLRLNDRKFSHRFINQKLGVKSSGWFGDVLAGRQRLKPVQVKNIATVFKINTEEQKCLRALVEMEAASNPEDLAIAYEKWLEAKGIRKETVSKDRFKFYDKWYYGVMRELLALHPRMRNPDILAKAIDPQITSKQAQQAVLLLERLGLISATDSESQRMPLPALVKDSTIRTRHWKAMMTAMMKLGLRALDRYDRDQRDFSGLTLTFSSEGLKKAGEEIAALRKRLLYLSEKDKASDRVYNCLFQIYPVTKPLELPHE